MAVLNPIESLYEGAFGAGEACSGILDFGLQYRARACTCVVHEATQT